MGQPQKKGFLLPPAVGYSFGVLWFLFSRYKISLKYSFRIFLTLLINLVNWPFRTIERIFLNRKYKGLKRDSAPVFIIGHWRSGTTHLHNILCQDPQMGYATTYQSVFPDTLLNRVGRFIFEGFAGLLIPGTRKGDNVILGTRLPQEEEFALGDKTPLCFYYFWMFPRKIGEFYRRYVKFEHIDEKLINSWESDYGLLINKALKNTGGSIFLSKNPPNTGRVKKILEMFPRARFIHIHRNPVEVFLSTRHFFFKMMPHLQLQKISPAELEIEIFDLYKNLMTDFLEQRNLIPESQLTEISFEELEESPMDAIRKLYSELNLKGFEEAAPRFHSYLTSMDSYEKNRHRISRSLLDKIMMEWDFAMKEWGYGIPEKIIIDHGSS
jgi:hypothetical protein